MLSVIQLIDLILVIYTWVLIVYVILGLLMGFGVVNAYNRFVNVVYEFLHKVTEPLLRPIRRFLPNFGAVDLSPLVLFLAIWLIRSLLWEYGPRLAV